MPMTRKNGVLDYGGAYSMKKFKLIIIVFHLIGEFWDWWTNSIDANNMKDGFNK